MRFDRTIYCFQFVSALKQNSSTPRQMRVRSFLLKTIDRTAVIVQPLLLEVDLTRHVKRGEESTLNGKYPFFKEGFQKILVNSRNGPYYEHIFNITWKKTTYYLYDEVLYIQHLIYPKLPPVQPCSRISLPYIQLVPLLLSIWPPPNSRVLQLGRPHTARSFSVIQPWNCLWFS